MYIKTTGIGKSIFSSFLKRFLIVSLAIIISFNTVCKPKETKAFALTLGTIATVVACVSGVVWTADMIIGWFSDNKQMDEPEIIDYFTENMSVDGDGNYIFSDDAQLTINQMLSDYNDSVTMTYRYPVQVQSISAENFPNNTVYQALVNLCLAYPDCYVFTTNEYKGNHRGEPYIDLEGNAKELPYDSTSDNFYLFNVIPAPFAGVTQYMDLYSASTTYYNDNWEKSFTPKNFWFTTDGRVFTYCNESLKVGSTNYSAYFKQIEPGTYPDLTELGSMYYWSWYGTSYAMYLDNKHGASLSARTVYSANVGALNVYKSEADMKKDIGSQVIGNYIPDCYTGTPNYNITTSEVNNIVNNYYPSDPDDDSGGGSGSGSDDSGGSSSGGSGIIDGLGKLFGSIGNIIDKLFGFVLGLLSKVVDFFGSILEMFTETLTKLIDIIPSGFNEFLAAMFPYIPEEWITIAEFILLVSAIGCVVALFKR